MFKQRSASPLGMRLIVKVLMPAAIIALALIYADPAHSQGDAHGSDGNSSENSNGSEPGENDAGGDHSTEGGDAPADAGDHNPPEDDNDAASDGEEELKSPPHTNSDGDSDNYGSAGNDSGSFFLASSSGNDRAKRRYESTRKELARLFVLDNTQIATEFPNGGFDQALVQAANRARRAERSFSR